MRRVLALDVGARRIGLALSDPLGITAQGLPTLLRSSLRQDLSALSALLVEHEVEHLIVGDPLRLDGAVGPAALAVRRFAGTLRTELGLPVDLWDERLTSAEVERIMLQGDLSRQRRRESRDRLAAVVILQSWLDAQTSKSE